MSYSFVLKQVKQESKINNQCYTFYNLNELVQSQNYIYSLKYYRNPYEEQLSYFILFTTHQNISQMNESNKQIQLKVSKKYQQSLKKQQTLEKQKFEASSDNKNQIIDFKIQFTLSQQNIKQEFIKRIVTGNFVHQNCFIVLQNPFQLYFITKKSKNPIKIILQSNYTFQKLSAYFSFQTLDQQKRKQPYSLIIYGQQSQVKKNILFSINLMTFDIKQVNQQKKYSPLERNNHFQIFHDDRLYVFGGKNQPNTLVQQLLWSFDLQKGYWFALQMKYGQDCQKFEDYMACVYDSGKVLILKDDRVYILEIYQCKISEVEIKQESFKRLLQQKTIKGIFTFEKKLCFYDKKSILPAQFSIQKVKN